MEQGFDHEKLDVYQLELEFVAWVSELLDEIRDTRGRRLSEITDQLDRASLSSLLNTAEGNGKRQSRARSKFFDDARGSATECAACLDALVPKGACEKSRVVPGKRMLIRIVSMLSKLIERFGGDDRVREVPPGYSANSRGFENEDDDENEDERIA